jgi:hypothetical protein
MMKNRHKEPLLHFHSQGLTKGSKDLFPEGRCWLFFGQETPRSPWARLGFEWQIGGIRRLDLSSTFAGEEHDLEFSIKIPFLFALWVMLESSFLRRIFRKIKQGFGYETAIEIDREAIRLHVLYNEVWGARQVAGDKKSNIYIRAADRPGFGFYISFYFLDWLFGRRKYSEENISEPVSVPIEIHPDTTLLGRKYSAKVRLYRATWKRPRSSRIDTIGRADVELETPIPIPGKGENSHDQGDDATYSLTCTADTPEQAIGRLVSGIVSRRKEYGLPDEIERELSSTFRF